GAVAAGANTPGHLVVADAGVAAVLTLLSARDACLNATGKSGLSHRKSPRDRCPGGTSIFADLNAVRLGGSHDAAFDELDLIFGVLGGVIRMVDVGPRRADVLGAVNRVLIVGRVGEFDVTVLALALLG